jgi:hypothetical protein
LIRTLAPRPDDDITLILARIPTGADEDVRSVQYGADRAP